jgi:tRNA(Ile)-lysidine synthase
VEIETFQRIVQEQCHLQPGLPVLIGVSGGPDSLCLLDLLARLEIPLVVAHFDHGLRPDSERDAEVVGRMAAAYAAVFCTARGNVALLARTAHLSIEEAARQARYRFLFEQAQAHAAQAVAVAHTADDQVETVLMHLLRGAGLDGLKGMPFRTEQPGWLPSLPLVRPLLGTWRADVEEYCRLRGLAPLYDPTNQETLYYRNRLRLELIPTLQAYNPQVKEVFWRMAQTLAGDQESLEALLEPLWQTCLLERAPGYVALDLARMLACLPGQQRSLLRRAMRLLRPGLRDIDFTTIERGRDFLEAPPATAQVDLAANLRLFVANGRLYLAEWGVTILDRDWLQIPPGQELELTVPGELILSGGRRLRADWCSSLPAPQLYTAPPANRVWLDARWMSLPLRVRTRRPGDRFQPLGLGGHTQKLSDFWINQHLPAPARPAWPLVCSGDQIAWVPGFRPAEPFKINPQSFKAIVLEITDF